LFSCWFFFKTWIVCFCLTSFYSSPSAYIFHLSTYRSDAFCRFVDYWQISCRKRREGGLRRKKTHTMMYTQRCNMAHQYLLYHNGRAGQSAGWFLYLFFFFFRTKSKRILDIYICYIQS
jgi:hypothetical protein